MYGTPDATKACWPMRPVSAEVMRELRALAETAPWKIVPGRAYQTAFCLDRLVYTKNLFERWHSALLINLPSQGKFHKHVDTRETYKSYHLPIVTNFRAFSCFEIEGKNVSMHLRAGVLYEYDRTVPHWAVNGGKTDRIHLLCEAYS